MKGYGLGSEGTASFYVGGRDERDQHALDFLDFLHFFYILLHFFINPIPYLILEPVISRIDPCSFNNQPLETEKKCVTCEIG